MATEVPVAPAGPAPATAPGTSPAPQPAAEPTANERVLAAYGVGPGAQPQQADQQGQPAAAPQAQDVWAEANLSPAQQAELQRLRTTAGRAARLGEFESQAAAKAREAEENARVAEQAVIEAVMAGADPRALAARIPGLDAEALAEVAAARGQQQGLPPGGDQRQQGQQQGGFNFVRRYADLKGRMNPAHPQSWTRPMFEAQDRAQSLRSDADMAVAQAVATGDPSMIEAARQRAELNRGLARQEEIRANEAMIENIMQVVFEAHNAMEARLKPFEEAHQAALAEEQQAQQVHSEWQNLGNSLRAERGPDGSARYGNGPGGAGIWEVDENGNCGKPTEHGRVFLKSIHDIITEHGWGRDRRSFELACDVLAGRLSSEGAAAQAAGQRPGGGDTLPGTSLAPGQAGARPSPQGGVFQPPNDGMY